MGRKTGEVQTYERRGREYGCGVRTRRSGEQRRKLNESDREDGKTYGAE
jgi:hypothetical protein